MEKLFFPCCVNGFLSTGPCAEKRMLSTCSFVKLLFHSFPQGSRVDSTGWCGQKLKLTVDVRRNVADVVGERSGACGKLLLDLFERVNDGRMVTAEFLADVGQA